MDPLSITASTLTLIVAANAAFEILATLSSAGEDIQDAIIQLNSVKDVLEQTQSFRQENSSRLSYAQVSAIGRLEQAANLKMRQINQILDVVAVASSGGRGLKISTLAWIRYRSRVTSLLGKLVSLCSTLSNLLGVINL